MSFLKKGYVLLKALLGASFSAELGRPEVFILGVFGASMSWVGKWVKAILPSLTYLNSKFAPEGLPGPSRPSQKEGDSSEATFDL